MSALLFFSSWSKNLNRSGFRWVFIDSDKSLVQWVRFGLKTSDRFPLWTLHLGIDYIFAMRNIRGKKLAILFSFFIKKNFIDYLQVKKSNNSNILLNGIPWPCKIRRKFYEQSSSKKSHIEWLCTILAFHYKITLNLVYRQNLVGILLNYSL
jgi:hypothetical protein